MNKKFLYVITAFLFFINIAKSQDKFKEVFRDDLNNNKNGWQTYSFDNFRLTTISNGKLTDWFGEANMQVFNLIDVYFNKANDYRVRFSIGILSNKKQGKVYTKKSNGKIKENWNKNPVVGFIWGFKDMKNYNAITFYNFFNSWGALDTKCDIYSIINGDKIAEDVGYPDITGSEQNQFITLNPQ